jgi:hypothetical protein
MPSHDASRWTDKLQLAVGGSIFTAGTLIALGQLGHLLAAG